MKAGSGGFGADFDRFLALGADRLVTLMGLLAARGVEGTILPMAGRRHVLARLGPGIPRILLVAHYDRVAGSPGALDNSAACLALAEAASRLKDEEGAAGVLLLFTDGEETQAGEGPLSQGSYALGLGLRSVLGPAHPSILVLDVVGRGERVLLSSAPRRGLERTGGGRGGRARTLAALEEEVARAAGAAGLSAPLVLPLPWSDDLGFTLAGLPALALSLLPEAEALRYGQALGSLPAGLPSLPSAAALGAAWPATWSLLHGPGDGPALIEAPSLAAVETLVLEFCRGSGKRK